MWAVIKVGKYDIEIEEHDDLDAAKAEYELAKVHDYREVMLVQVVERHKEV